MLFLVYKQWCLTYSGYSFALSRLYRMKTKQTIAIIGVTGNMWSSIEIVSDIVTTAGFNPVIAGNLSASKTLELI